MVHHFFLSLDLRFYAMCYINELVIQIKSEIDQGLNGGRHPRTLQLRWRCHALGVAGRMHLKSAVKQRGIGWIEDRGWY